MRSQKIISMRKTKSPRSQNPTPKVRAFSKKKSKNSKFRKKSWQTSISEVFFFILGSILRTEDEKSEMNFEKSTNYFNL